MRRGHAATRHGDNGTQALGRGDRQPGMLPSPPPWLLSELGHGDKPPDGPRDAETHGKPQHATDTRHHAKHTQTHGEGTWGGDGDTHTHTQDGTQE